MSNIIQFPRQNTNVLSFNQARENIETARSAVAEEASADAVNFVISKLHEFGIVINFEDTGMLKNLAFIQESIVALIHRSYGMSHNFHEMIEKIVPEEIDDVEEMLEA